MRLIRIIALSVMFGCAAVFTWPVQAEFKLRYPIVEFRELEIEHNGSVTFDKRNSGKNNSQSFPTEVEFGHIVFVERERLEVRQLHGVHSLAWRPRISPSHSIERTHDHGPFPDEAGRMRA